MNIPIPAAQAEGQALIDSVHSMPGQEKVEGDLVAFSLIPRTRFDSIYDIDPAALRSAGIRLLLLDLDNTIAPYGTSEPSAKLLAWVARLRAEGVEPFVLSNSRKATRVPNFAALLGVPFLRHAGKPKRAGFLYAMRTMQCSPAETAMVGDQIFTDILGANRSGVSAILVKPLRMDTLFRVLRYGLETPFRCAAPRARFDDRRRMD